MLLLRFFLGHSAEPAAAAAEKTTSEPVGSPYRDKIYLGFIGCTIVFAACFFQLFSVLPVFYKKELHMPEYMIGLLMTMNGLLITIVEMVLVFRLEGRRGNLVYVFWGTCLVASSYLLLNILPLRVYTAYFCMLLTTGGEMMTMSFLASFWIARTQPANRGQYAGLYTIAWSTAQVIGPAGGAEIAQRAGFRVLWWLVGGICLLAGFGFRRLRKML
jgi:predicted MFS family arabinose efflux permease